MHVLYTAWAVLMCMIAAAASHPTGMAPIIPKLLHLFNYHAVAVTGSSSYVRWDRTTCPSSCDTSLVYSGRVGGTHYGHQGGAADYLCLPDNPEYSDFTPGSGGSQNRQVQ